MKTLTDEKTINQVKAIAPIVTEIEKSIKKNAFYDKLTGFCVKNNFAFTTNGKILVGFETETLETGRYIIIRDNLIDEYETSSDTVDGKRVVCKTYDNKEEISIADVKSGNRLIQSLGLMMRATGKYFDYDVLKPLASLFKSSDSFILSWKDEIDAVKVSFDNGLIAMIIPYIGK